MIFFDTSVLVYSIVNQDSAKQKLSDTLILKAFETDQFLISPLVFSELYFVLSKLNVPFPLIADAALPYQNLKTVFPITIEMTNGAFELCSVFSSAKNINDAIHLKYAEKYCDELITFDKDFRNFTPHTNLKITIL